MGTGLLAAWAVRLGSFLFSRIQQDGRDVRFTKVLKMPTVLLQFWLFQAAWVFLTGLPIWIANSKEEDDTKKLGMRDYAGWALWLSGFWFQVLADRQKRAFRADPANHGKFITTGLWGRSRHPNYFGEIAMWTGLTLSSSAVLRGAENLAWISPVWVWYLLTKISGVPKLHSISMKRWGKDPVFLRYLAETNLLLPHPFRSFAR